MSLGKLLVSTETDSRNVLIGLGPSTFYGFRRPFVSNMLRHSPFCFWLVDASRPSRIVEIGDHAGFLYPVFGEAASASGVDARCFSILAPVLNADSAEHRRMRSAEITLFNEKRYSDASELIIEDYRAAAQRFADGSVDLLSISGPCAETEVHAILAAWLPKLSVRGVILISGIEHKNASGWEAWNSIKTHYPHFSLSGSEGLGVLFVGPEIPVAVRDLRDATPEAVRSTQRVYAWLGEAIAREDLARAPSLPSQARVPTTGSPKAGNVPYLGSLPSDKGSDLETLDGRRRKIVENEEFAAQAAALHHVRSELTAANSKIQALLASSSWRITAPLRFLVISLTRPSDFASRARWWKDIVVHSVRTNGFRETGRKVYNFARRKTRYTLMGGPGFAVRWSKERLPAPTQKASAQLAPRVLIIAEVSMPQCLKYRVTQKQAMIESLGFECTVLRWNDVGECLNALQTHAMVIFYRVPAFPDVMRIFDEAKALAVPSFWEVDDIIFDAEMYLTNLNLDEMPEVERRGLIEGVKLYRSALFACDGAIASTRGLADAMRKVGVKDVRIVENAYDEQTLAVAAKINAIPKVETDVVRIVYGSGTKTHDADFREASAGIYRLLQERKHLRLCIAGHLTLPKEFDSLTAQVERAPFSDYPNYLAWLATGDISIAPLEKSIFNDAKSNIKLLEAASVRLPSVCSPAAEFVSAIKHGESGFLASDENDWYEQLKALIDDPDMRRRVGQKAQKEMLLRYEPSAIAKTRVQPILDLMTRKPSSLRILGVNVYYAPRSFGGATIVAEEMATRLNKMGDVEYAMFTSVAAGAVPDYELIRYEAKDTLVFGLGLPPIHSMERRSFENLDAVPAFREALRAFRPDVVHLHSIQGISADIAAICVEEKVKFAITVHDAWWICGRQFMINNEGRFCGQEIIDLNVCATCVPDAQLNNYRQDRLRHILATASLVLAPSEYFRKLYIDNGVDADRIVTNKNGISPPRTHISVSDRQTGVVEVSSRVRFGYVGGNTPIKGIHLIKKAFEGIRSTNYEIVIVDNMLNMGSASFGDKEWSGLTGTVNVVPAYNQQTIDTFFSSIDVLLFPTQWKESFGLTVREAAARDVWVIATDAGGVIEDIVEGVNGDVIPLADDGTVLRQKIEALLAEPQKIKAFVNPTKAEIRLFDQQAMELRELLSSQV